MGERVCNRQTAFVQRSLSWDLSWAVPLKAEPGQGLKERLEGECSLACVGFGVSVLPVDTLHKEVASFCPGTLGMGGFKALN